MQEIVFTGACISEPKVYTAASKDGPEEYTQFYCACSRIRKKGEDRKTDYFSVKAFGKRGEAAKRFIHKGMKIYIRGELQAEVLERPSGKIDIVLGVEAKILEFLGKREDIDETILCISEDQDEYIDIAEDLVGW